MSQQPQAGRVGNITVDSDWLTTTGLGLLFVALFLLLVKDVHSFIWGHLTEPSHVQMNYWSISNRVFEGIAAIYGFIFAFTFTQKLAKVACVLMGTRLAAFAVLSSLNISTSVRRVAAISGSIVSQVALVIFLVAIAQWFKSVIRRDPPSELQAGNH
jgi:hypothetical protein